MRMPRVRTALAFFALSVIAAFLLKASPKEPLRLPLKVEKLAAPEGVTLPSFETLELAPAGGSRYDVRLLPGADGPRLSGADLGLLVPRVPRLARGSETLTRLALLQREFNRNEIHNVLADGVDFSIANNCLERGLWEVKLAKPEGGRNVTIFHAWFTFPREEYAALFREVNGGLDEAKFDALLEKYPGMGGFTLSLADLRAVKSERELASVASHAADELDRLTEQKGKTRLIRTSNLSTYGDVVKASSQPIKLAKFTPPGLYDPSESMTFDLSWLGRAPRIVWRQVSSPQIPAAFPELELRFDNGLRILAADPKIAELPPRREAPAVEADVLKLVCGIGTPVIHATAAERAAEMSEDRPRYLMILDSKSVHVDNHLTGVDGMYVWREAGEPGKLHLWLVSYERIALVAHYSVPWPV